MLWSLPTQPKKLPAALKKLDPIIALVLYRRGVRTSKAVRRFFSLAYDHDYYDPYKIKGMRRAVNRVLTAAQKKQSVVVYGDYDADGVTSTALMTSILKKIGLTAGVYIPSREQEGHGLKEKALRELARQGAQLVITVDCGISDLKPVATANKLGLDVIIVDHHLPAARLPRAYALINPYQKGDRYPFKPLCACGVVFKFAQALAKAAPDKLAYASLQRELDLVAVATIADLVPLLGENRLLTKHGLLMLAKTKRLGLKALMATAGMDPPSVRRRGEGFSIKNLDAFSVGFIIAPRLNAASRMDHGLVSYHLLNSRQTKEAYRLASQLEASNRQRQTLQKQIAESIQKKLSSLKQVPPVICEGNPDWPVGVVGIVAGILAEKYYRPALVYHRGETVSRASGRTTPAINIYALLQKCDRFLMAYGGHAGAAGLTIETKKIPSFVKCITAAVKRETRGAVLEPRLKIDAVLKPEAVTLGLAERIDTLAPFGKENPMPRFLTKALQLKSCRLVGKNGNHLKLEFANGSRTGPHRTWAGIWFRQDNVADFKPGQRYDVVYELLCDEWQGEKKLTLKVIDMKTSK